MRRKSRERFDFYECAVESTGKTRALLQRIRPQRNHRDFTMVNMSAT
jgi:hypothetical protein